VLLWLAAVAAATAVGMTAVSAIGTDLFGDSSTPLSQSEVDDQLASRTAPPTSSPSSSSPPPTSASSSPPPPVVGQQRTVSTAGGTVTARCEAGGVRVLQAVPAQGFRVDPDDDVIDDHPSVKFQAGDREIEVRFRCAGGLPQPEIKDD
jgi:hypothetical protein